MSEATTIHWPNDGLGAAKYIYVHIYLYIRVNSGHWRHRSIFGEHIF